MSTFRLQQFSIEQSQSGMKVCSDSLLFGAMIPLNNPKRILDIGTGTGILALMQAQKVHSSHSPAFEGITAVELTAAAAQEAKSNFINSPWANSIVLVEQDIQSFAKQSQPESYDLIICNPPFFVDHSRTQPENDLRGLARHSDTLSYEELCRALKSLLATGGYVYLLLPTAALDQFANLSRLNGFDIIEIVEISESQGHNAKVASLCLAAQTEQTTQAEQASLPARKSIVYKFDADKNHSPKVKAYLSDFLLRYAK